MCWAQINTWNVFDCAVEFGGYKLSGIGREHGDEVLHHYTQVLSSLPYTNRFTPPSMHDAFSIFKQLEEFVCKIGN